MIIIFVSQVSEKFTKCYPHSHHDEDDHDSYFLCEVLKLQIFRSIINIMD